VSLCIVFLIIKRVVLAGSAAKFYEKCVTLKRFYTHNLSSLPLYIVMVVLLGLNSLFVKLEHIC
jgi:hypothetical protein